MDGQTPHDSISHAVYSVLRQKLLNNVFDLTLRQQRWRDVGSGWGVSETIRYCCGFICDRCWLPMVPKVVAAQRSVRRSGLAKDCCEVKRWAGRAYSSSSSSSASEWCGEARDGVGQSARRSIVVVHMIRRVGQPLPSHTECVWLLFSARACVSHTRLLDLLYNLKVNSNGAVERQVGGTSQHNETAVSRLSLRR